jgi:undecaprenyl-diphosphatase
VTVFQALVLGIIQGLTEFLPISSSAHLSLTPWLFGWPYAGLAFDVALHVGTLVAVLWYFRSQWFAMFAAGIRILRKRRAETVDEKRVIFLVIATIPGAIAGYLLNDLAETVLRHPALTGFMLILLGTILWLVDRQARTDRSLDRMRWLDALLVGLAQVVALVPGVSRSGATMTAGRALGFTRADAAVFSFLMSMPITAAAAIFKVPDAINEAGGIHLPLIVGVIASAVSGWAAIAGLIKYVASRSFAVFAAYHWVLGVFVLWLVFTRGV